MARTGTQAASFMEGFLQTMMALEGMKRQKAEFAADQEAKRLYQEHLQAQENRLRAQEEAERPYREAQTAYVQAQAENLKRAPEREAAKDRQAEAREKRLDEGAMRRTFAELLKGGETYGLSAAVSGYRPTDEIIDQAVQEAISAGTLQGTAPSPLAQIQQAGGFQLGPVSEPLATRAKAPAELRGEVMGQRLPAFEESLRKQKVKEEMEARRVAAIEQRAKASDMLAQAQIKNYESQVIDREGRRKIAQAGLDAKKARDQWDQWFKKYQEDNEEKYRSANLRIRQQTADTAAQRARTVRAQVDPYYKMGITELAKLQKQERELGARHVETGNLLQSLQAAPDANDPTSRTYQSLIQAEARWKAEEHIMRQVTGDRQALEGELQGMSGWMATLPGPTATNKAGKPRASLYNRPGPMPVVGAGAPPDIALQRLLNASEQRNRPGASGARKPTAAPARPTKREDLTKVPTAELLRRLMQKVR